MLRGFVPYRPAAGILENAFHLGLGPEGSGTRMHNSHQIGKHPLRHRRILQFGSTIGGQFSTGHPPKCCLWQIARPWAADWHVAVKPLEMPTICLSSLVVPYPQLQRHIDPPVAHFAKRSDPVHAQRVEESTNWMTRKRACQSG